MRWTSTTREEEFLVAVAAALALGASDFSMSSMMLQTLPMASEVTSTERLCRIWYVVIVTAYLDTRLEPY